MEEKKTIAVEFEDGEDIIAGLKQAFSENKVQRVSIKSVEGRIKEFELSVFGGGIFRKKFIEDEFKVTSLHGTMLEKGNMGYKGELVVGLARTDSRSSGGILLNAKASGSLIIKAEVLEFK